MCPCSSQLVEPGVKTLGDSGALWVPQCKWDHKGRGNSPGAGEKLKRGGPCYKDSQAVELKSPLHLATRRLGWCDQATSAKGVQVPGAKERKGC